MISFNRRLGIRCMLVLLYFLLGSVMFIFNRGHTLLVDNRNLEEGNLNAPARVMVSVNGGKALEFYSGDRDRFRVKGINQSIRFEFPDGRPPYEGSFKLPIMEDTYILSIPQTLAQGVAIPEPFHIAPQPAAEDELPVIEGAP